MESWSLKFIADTCAGQLSGGAPTTKVRRVCTDSRRLEAGDLFFALQGEQFDGHDFLRDAAAKGAGAAVVCRSRVRLPYALGNCALIAVEDTRRALGQLAARHRKDFTLPVIAVAGSNGKTTTKDLLVSVLGQKLATLGSEASFNNDVGVPVTLLNLKSHHQAAVLEAGTNHPGELAPLIRMIAPTYGVLTSIGREHLEFFGDLAGVAQEEGCLAELLPSSGKLFINGDTEWSQSIARRSKAAVVPVGFAEGNHWRALPERGTNGGAAGEAVPAMHQAFRVEGPESALNGSYRIPLVGRHQMVNAVFAIALGAELGLSRSEIQEGLSRCKPPKMRMQFLQFNGVSVLDDCYNANTDSMLAALQTLQELPCKGRRIAVLGDMAELGTQSEAAHEEVGRRAAELGIQQLFAIGKMARAMARGARGAGLDRVLEFAEVPGAGAAVKKFVRTGDALLLKASRATHLERVLHEFGMQVCV